MNLFWKVNGGEMKLSNDEFISIIENNFTKQQLKDLEPTTEDDSRIGIAVKGEEMYFSEQHITAILEKYLELNPQKVS